MTDTANGGGLGGHAQFDKEVPIVTEGSDLFVCQADDNLNLDDVAFKSHDYELGCVISTTSGEIKGKTARIEILDKDSADLADAALHVKMFVKHKTVITLKNDEQVILQCPGGSC